MTQGEIEKIGYPAAKIFTDLEIRIMKDIVRRIKINGFSTATADWQITRLQQLGNSEEDIKGWIKGALGASEEEMERIFSDETYKEYMGHERAYELFGKEQIPFEENESLQNLIEATKKQLALEFQNMANSMGFAIRDPYGKIMYTPLLEYYRKTLDNAVIDIKSGAFSYQQVLERTIKEMTASGIRWINYDSGWHNRVDVAVRRAVLTGFRQVQGKMNEQVAEELNTDSYEVTYHVGARPSHQSWQGKVYTKQELEAVCGLGTVTGLHGANCYHDYRPFIPGVSVRTYTDEQLARMAEEENTPKDYYGKQYTTYEALQQQRKMETAMRATRQQIQLLKEGEADPTSITLKKAKYYGLMQNYQNFSEKMKLPMQKTRIYQDGLKGNFSDKRAYDRLQVMKSKKESLQGAKFIEKDGSIGYIIRTQKDFEKAATDIKKEIEQYTVKKSKWSGKIKVFNALDKALGLKEWSCDISVINTADDGIIWHEMLHSCSASYYTPEIYAANQAIEEASVEYLKQQICKNKGIESIDAYGNAVLVLQILNNSFGYGSDLFFAKELFNVPLPQRYQWLEDKVDESLRKAGASFEEYNDVMSFVETLKGKLYD